MKTQRFIFNPLSLIMLSLVFVISACDKDETDDNGNGGENGNDDHFNYGTVTDEQGNEYKTIEIGSQEWMAENLRVTVYNDGSSINSVPDPTDWSYLDEGGYAWYENDQATYESKLGALYNWFAVDTDSLCPDGWHVPTVSEWETLLDHVAGEGHEDAEGKALKASSGWEANGNGTNDFGFGALPGGFRGHAGAFDNVGYQAYFWSSDEHGQDAAESFVIYEAQDKVYQYDYSKNSGFSVRCLKD
ncbi:MAG: FISUMP domain-containing protein [Bacteroidales bacterium]